MSRARDIANQGAGTFGSVTADDLTVDTTTLVVDEVNNRVGIGTSSPSYPLHISSSGDANARSQTTSTSGEAQFFVQNPTGDGGLAGALIYGSAKAAYGALGSGEAAYYSNRALTIMSDTGSGIIKFATGGNSERMRIHSGGEITSGSQPAFLALHGGGDAVTNATSYTIPFNNEKFDQGGDFSSTTFTAPVSGRYAFHAFVRVDAGGSSNTRFSEYIIQLVTSNRTVTNAFSTQYTNADDRMGAGLSVVVDMDASDTAYVSVFCSRYGASGGTTTVGNTANPDTYFSGYLVC